MQYFGKTDVGMKRTVNQDNFSIKEYAPGILLAVVCDGMGGARGGREASYTATDCFVSAMDAFVDNHITEQHTIECTDAQIHRALRSAAEVSNKAVFLRAEEDESLRGMGTTLVAVLIVGKTVYTVNVGDSRMYIVQQRKPAPPRIATSSPEPWALNPAWTQTCSSRRSILPETRYMRFSAPTA